MQTYKKISERLPHFYKHWDPVTSINGLITVLGMRLDETEKEMISIIRAHWVDTANHYDLDKIGALYNLKRHKNESDFDYRNRLKTAIISYKGGGTKSAIIKLVSIALRLPEERLSEDYPVNIVENPAIELKRIWKISAGKEWWINPRNIEDTVPQITLRVVTENARVTNLKLINLTTNEMISFRGDISYGDVLKITGGKAYLNENDASDRLSATTTPSLPRRKSKWRYEEEIGANLGAFDITRFDESVFIIDIISEVTFEWIARQPASFILELPNELLMRSGVTAEYMQHLVNLVKACGVRAEVKVTGGGLNGL